MGPLGIKHGHANPDTDTDANPDTDTDTDTDTNANADAHPNTDTYFRLRSLCCRYQLSGWQCGQQCGRLLPLRRGRLVFDRRICL